MSVKAYDEPLYTCTDCGKEFEPVIRGPGLSQSSQCMDCVSTYLKKRIVTTGETSQDG